MIKEVLKRLKHIIAHDLEVNINEEDIKDNASLFEEGVGLDSVTIMEFITLIESNFGFRFSDEELTMEPFADIQTLAQFISDKAKGQ